MGKVYRFGGIPRRLNFEPSKECLKLMRSGYGPEPFGESGQKRAAINYAVWLAARAGHNVAELGSGEVIWSFMPAAAGKWRGERRPMAVRFQIFEEFRGRWGRDRRPKGEPLVIAIPNWNWEPECVELGAELKEAA